MIYFLQDSGNLSIKIGWAKDDAEARRDVLQTGNPSKLVLLATMPGERSNEKELHKRFDAHRIAGEWFKPCPELLQLVCRASVGSQPINRKPPLAVYVAGKITGAVRQEPPLLRGEQAGMGWRSRIMDRDDHMDETDSGHDGSVPRVNIDECGQDWPVSKGLIWGEHDYTGPYPADRVSKHGGYLLPEQEGWHGQLAPDERQATEGGGSPANQPGNATPREKRIVELCLRAIRRSDLVFAWIDSHDCYGTVAEIGYAVALGIPVYAASPRPFRDMWFAFTMSAIGERVCIWESVGYALNAAVHLHLQDKTWMDQEGYSQMVFREDAERRRKQQAKQDG